MSMPAPAPQIVQSPTSTMRQNIHLVPRRMEWDFSDVPACPVEGDPNLAAFLLAISYFVVAFEDFGIPVVRAELPRLVNYPALAREAQAFVTQEALHSQAHVQFNTVMNNKHGIDTTVINREFHRILREMRQGSQQEQLATVAAFEHVIFSVAEWYEKATEVRKRVHPEFNRLVLWHAMEETEHTAVVYDMYTYLYGTDTAAYRIRVAALARATRMTLRTIARLWRALVPQMATRLGKNDSDRWKPWVLVAREGVKYLGDFFSFLSPRFTPWASPEMASILPLLRKQMVPAWSNPADASQWMTVRVAGITDAAADVRAYELEAEEASLPAWEAGAHIDVEVETGVVRQYSLCGDPRHRARYRIAVKRDLGGRGGSLRMHTEINIGDRIRVGMPRNLFALDVAKARREQTLLLAGGIGITPLLAMAHTLHAAGADFRFHLCARDMRFLPFTQEASQWAFRERVQVHLDATAPAGRVNLTSLIPAWEASQPRSLYICGPAAFIDAVCSKAREAGWPASAVQFERFALHAGPKSTDQAFTLHLARSNVALTVAADQTIVEAMEAHGLQPKSQCREGVCGACVCKVNAGEVDHRDAVLSDEQRQERDIAICVSRAKGGSLTIDL